MAQLRRMQLLRASELLLQAPTYAYRYERAGPLYALCLCFDKVLLVTTLTCLCSIVSVRCG
jgi:hypothetical protein